MRISTDTCQTGTDRIKWQSDHFPEHWEATKLQRANTKQHQTGAQTHPFPPEAADATTTLKITGVGSKALQMFSRKLGEISAGIGYLTESRGRKEEKRSNGK